MTDPINTILNALSGVKETKPEQWIAQCPSHGDRNPSLAIMRGDDGRALLKCWAGCTALEVVEAAGLELRDLFEHPIKCTPHTRKRLFPKYKKILQLLQQQIWIIYIVSCDIKNSCYVSDASLELLANAISDIDKMLVASDV